MPFRTRHDVRRRLTACVVLATLLLAGCGDDSATSEDGGGEPSARPSLSADALGPPVAMTTDIEGGPSPDRIAELLEIVDSTDISGGTAELGDCPLGTPEAVLAAFPPGLEAPTELPGRVDPYSAFSDDEGGGVCLSGGLLLSFERVPGSLDEGQVLAASTQYRSEVSAPIDFFGGRAYTACATSDPEVIRCRASWYGDGLQVAGDVSSASEDAESVAAWFSSALPVMLGGEDVAAAVTPFSVAGSTDLTDPEGYTITADYDFSASPFSEDPTNSPPGSTELVLTTDGSVTVTNTTVERATDIGTFIVHPAGIYDAGGVVCTFLEEVGTQGVASTDDYCMLRVGTSITWLFAESPTFEPGESQTRTTSDSMSNDVSETRIADVPEDRAAELMAALQEPTGVLLYGGLPGGEDFNDPPKWQADTGCTLAVELGGNSYDWLVYTTDKTPDDIC